MSKKQGNRHYINGKRFTELSKRAQLSGEVSEEWVTMVYVLATKTFQRRGTPRHSFIDLEEEDAVQEAVMDCFKKIKKFKPGRGDAYSFYRDIIRKVYCDIADMASRLHRNPGVSIHCIESHLDIETDNRISFLLMESQKQTARSFKKLRRKDVVDMKRRLAAGETGAEIARDYDVDPTTVSKIKLGKIWGDV